ncbi:hypothetical protein [Clostridium estertheticum]|uniref:hypothetical protein n=1 Tax=Clostridium estertheticum TaxID=238834 RepID=UPI00124D026D|nr:hypothetical protein [Clostridium estertheticum]MBZ9615281.1 hypothetical protein [Clostridium estertheticum subsp. laramiense]WAG75170.1 hypothetical protein LL032_06895 [Clostridium estertheticum]
MKNIYKTTTLPSGSIITETDNPSEPIKVVPIVSETPQPTNQEINNNQMTIMEVLASLTEALASKGVI